MRNTGNKQQFGHDFESINDLFQGYGKYYTTICRSMADIIFNWAFALNTGGIITTVTFMGAALKWEKLLNLKDFLPFLYLMLAPYVRIVVASE